MARNKKQKFSREQCPKCGKPLITSKIKAGWWCCVCSGQCLGSIIAFGESESGGIDRYHEKMQEERHV